MGKLDVEKTHKILTEQLQVYIKSIINKYGKYIPYERLSYLRNIENYGNIIRIYDYGSINGFANSYNNTINMPLSADNALRTIAKIPGFGINKKHKTYNENNLIINDNTFVDYIKHVFISGTDTLGYYEDLLLHETMHFCGGDGGSSLKEGINELLTRKIAKDNNFRTNACGYPKEVKIAHELETLFGEEIISQIAFLNNERGAINFLKRTLGENSANLYIQITNSMEKEFYEKYYKHINDYNGISGILKKASNYKKINYENVCKLIGEYKEKKKNKIETNKEKIEEQPSKQNLNNKKYDKKYMEQSQYFDEEISYKKHR